MRKTCLTNWKLRTGDEVCATLYELSKLCLRACRPYHKVFHFHRDAMIRGEFKGDEERV